MYSQSQYASPAGPPPNSGTQSSYQPSYPPGAAAPTSYATPTAPYTQMHTPPPGPPPSAPYAQSQPPDNTSYATPTAPYTQMHAPPPGPPPSAAYPQSQTPNKGGYATPTSSYTQLHARPPGPPPSSAVQPLYQPVSPGPSTPYAPINQNQRLINDSGYSNYSWADKQAEYGAPLEVKRKRVNDVIFLLLFILQLCGFIGITTLVLLKWIKGGGLDGGVSIGVEDSNAVASVTLDKHTVVLLLLASAAALLLSVAHLMVVRMFTRRIIYFTLLSSPLLNFGLSGYYWATRYHSAAIAFTVFGAVSTLTYLAYRTRIPLATLFLQVVIDISKEHLSVYVVAFFALFIQAVLAVWFSFATIATYAMYSPGNPFCSNTGIHCSTGMVVGLIALEAFCFLWTSQVVGNVALATIAGGPFGTWYYYGSRSRGYMPTSPTFSAFGRASTLSLGSIAFGSLVVTILEFIRTILNMARQSSEVDGNPAAAAMACCAECFIGCIESFVEYFNRYAYIEIALYGKPYLQAARDTWRLFKDRGVDALVNDSLVSMTLTAGAYNVGLLSSSLGYFYLRYTHPSYNDQGQYYVPVVLFAFVIGFQCSLTLSSVIEAGVSTLFVGLGEDPQVLAERAPDLFRMIRRRYPKVVHSVQGGPS